jgi:hypothetical protein
MGFLNDYRVPTIFSDPYSTVAIPIEIFFAGLK